MGGNEALIALCTLLQGRTPRSVPWVEVVNIANKVLLTPTLSRAVSDRRGALPAELADFLDEVASRNRQRNARLRGQLAEALRALAEVEILPTLLKGGASLIATGAERDERMISDLDLLVARDQVGRAISALQGAGFGLLSRFDNDDSHVAAEFGRDMDVGMIDLHRRPPGPRHLMSAPRFVQRTERVFFEGFPVHLPSPELQILQLAMHDQLHDGDYWSGVIDLRHLHDTAVIANTRSVDWAFLQGAGLGGLVLSALGRHLAGAAELFGAPVPPALISSAAMLALRRSLLQVEEPRLRPVITAVRLAASAPAAIAHYGRERRWRLAEARMPSTAAARRGGRLARLRQVFGTPSPVKL